MPTGDTPAILHPHPELPKGRLLTKAETRDLLPVVYHASPTTMPGGHVLRSEDFATRPHYELFRQPPHDLDHPTFQRDRRVEAVLDIARRAVNPEAPSRKSAVFAFSCRECATWFRDLSRPEGSVHRCQILRYEKVLVADLILRNVLANLANEDEGTTLPFGANTVEEALDLVAKLYWDGIVASDRGAEQSCAEVLIIGEIEVLGIEN